MRTICNCIIHDMKLKYIMLRCFYIYRTHYTDSYTLLEFLRAPLQLWAPQDRHQPRLCSKDRRRTQKVHTLTMAEKLLKTITHSRAALTWVGGQHLEPHLQWSSRLFYLWWSTMKTRSPDLSASDFRLFPNTKKGPLWNLFLSQKMTSCEL